MSTRPKKRRSTGRNYETEPNLNQVHFAPVRRTIRERGPAWSAPSKRQQTITQMNPLRSFYHPSSEDEDMKSDHGDEEGQGSYIASLVGRKRRKVMPTRQTITRSTRWQTITQMNPFHSLYHPEPEDVQLKSEEIAEKESREPSPITRKARQTAVKKKSPGSAEGMVKSQASRANDLIGQQDARTGLPQKRRASRLSKPQTAAASMPPPQTPLSSKKKEIPSSQSPADTPVSARSRRPMREYSRSPLKERSTNIVLSTPRNSARWRAKLVGADSLDSREDDSPVLTRGKSEIESLGSVIHQADVDTEELSILLVRDVATHGASPDYVPRDKHRRAAVVRDSVQAATGKEVLDSDEDIDEDEDDKPSVDNQTVLVSSSAPSIPSPSLQDTLERTCSVVNCQSKGHNSQPNYGGVQELFNIPQSTQRNKSTNQHSSPRFQIVEYALNDPAISHQPAPSSPTLHRTDSEQASAQLFGDLRRVTEPILETESQFEAAWHSYHPAGNENSHDEPSNILSSPNYIQVQSSPPTTVPRQPPSAHADTNLTPPKNSRQFKVPVPPSQATTTDITQPSPRDIPSSQIFPSSRRAPASSHIQVPSSPPPMPPLSSSPVAGRKATDPWERFEWNGVRLTDSQLLPESLLNDSLIGPGRGFWRLSQEGLEEE
ncbi:hypothetical protein N7G274_002503 [Stereocaulon virgatum]|uniref:Uncharacterized protein n=1 Tax=Stereocaulon virgatum TaxID=373712 RepID=A0ABR4AFZ7_9LECA